MRWSTVKQGELFSQLDSPAVQIPEDRMREVRVLLADMIIGILCMKKAEGTAGSQRQEGADE